MLPPFITKMAISNTVNELTRNFPLPSHPKICRKPTYELLYELHRKLMENAFSVPSTIGGGGHGLLGLTTTAKRYQQLTGHAFQAPPNVGPVPIINNQFMQTAEIAARRENHQAELNTYTTYLNTDQAFCNQLISTTDNIYIKSLQQNIIRYNNHTTRVVLSHLYWQYGKITPIMLQEADK
eukprot:7729981-Ditylum_brightwellii.AAC.1